MNNQLIPRELQPIKQWVLWQRDEDRKKPINPFTFGNAGIEWKNTWGTFREVSEAFALYPTKAQGIGFVLTESDPYTVIDLDDCFVNDELVEPANELIHRFQSYTEYSPSGRGLHIWLRASSHNHKRKGLEIYSYSRWMTVTGRPLEGFGQLKISERQSELNTLISSLQQHRSSPGARKRIEASNTLKDDAELWSRLFRAHNGQVYQALFNGDVSVCQGDHSRAVIFLSNQLAVMTDFDAIRIRRLLEQTLLRNDKWYSKRGLQDWLEGRIQDAINYMSARAK